MKCCGGPAAWRQSKVYDQPAPDDRNTTPRSATAQAKNGGEKAEPMHCAPRSTTPTCRGAYTYTWNLNLHSPLCHNPQPSHFAPTKGWPAVLWYNQLQKKLLLNADTSIQTAGCWPASEQ